MERNVFLKTMRLMFASGTLLSLAGCLNYQRPPQAVDSSSYTVLK